MTNKSENKFSVGDKVVCIARNTHEHVAIGFTYTVSECLDSKISFYECRNSFYSTDNFQIVEQKEKEMTFKNMKFDVAAIAKQLNVEHEEASRIIQEALFEQGYKHYAHGTHAPKLDLDWIFTYADGDIDCGYTDKGMDLYLASAIKSTYTIVKAEEQKELIELNGKKYNKQELEKALSLLKPIE